KTVQRLPSMLLISKCDRDETNYELAVVAGLPLSPRGTSGERAGERGPKRPPLPDALLLVGGFVFCHSHARHVPRQTKLQRPWCFQPSGTGVPPVRIVQPTHGRDARATTKNESQIGNPKSKIPPCNTSVFWAARSIRSISAICSWH